MKTKDEAISAAHSNIVDSTYTDLLVKRRDIKEYETLVNNEDPEELTRILESKSKKERWELNLYVDFSEYMRGKMFDSPPEEQQFVLTGSPSAGKTTELNRISSILKENIDGRNNSIIHLFSLQNASENQSSLDSAADLWQWIIRSHSSRIWAEQRYTLAEFIEVNNRLNLQPVLLIDTVDLLIYGEDDDDREKIVKYWNTIISSIKKETNWTVLWSCRKFEYNQITKDDNLDLIEIQLPGLDLDEVAGRFNHDRHDVEMATNESAFLTALGCVFPIVAGQKKNLSEWSHIILARYRKMHDYARNVDLSIDDIRQNASPIPWIIENLRLRDSCEIIGVDPLYEGLVDVICQEIHLETNKEKSYLMDLWGEIESEFWEAAYAPHTNNSRIHITHSSITLEDDDDDKFLQYLIDAAINNKLLRTNSRSRTYEMTHQLFAEYCIWKVSVKLNRQNESWIENFPSCKIRGLRKVVDKGSHNETLIKEAEKWFQPFYVFNEKLAHRLYDEGMKDYDQAWRDGIQTAFSVQLKTYSKKTVSANTNVMHERYLNDEKRDLLQNIDNATPLLVNGPPGVGKSHLSYVWIDKKASGATWTELQPGVERKINDAVWRQKPKAHFMTLSRGLVKQIENKIDDYYDTSARPAEFISWSIPKYIEKMRDMLGIETTDELTLDIFSQELVEAKKSGVGGWKKISAEELWGEFQNNYIDKFGARKNTKDYEDLAYRSEFFNFVTDADTQSKLFAQWAKNVGGSKKSLSEQAGECIKKVMDIIFGGSLEDREAIRSMQSDILVLDEIQDLPSPVIFLLLLMHNGSSGSVMMCGDDEQTLELSEFKWDDTFSKIQSAFWEYNDMYKDHPLYEANSRILMKWLDRNLLNEMVGKNMQHLVVVERSVPPIVECVSESWNNGVSNKISGLKRKHGEIRGTGCIKAGKISEYRQENNKAEGTIDGVEIHNNWSWNQLINLARKVYDDGRDVAFLFPDKKLWKIFSEKLASEDIFMDLWTPRLIKGLEYPEVIAICPWDISRKDVDEIIMGDSKWKNWDEIETYAEKNENTSDDNARRKIDCIIKMAKKKKRHVNVMLSRSQDLLKIVNISDGMEYFTSQIPTELPDLIGVAEFAELEPKPEPKRKKELLIGQIELPKGQQKAIDEDDELKAEKTRTTTRTTTHALINRLRRIILSADTAADRVQIQLKANHLAHYLKKTNDIFGAVILEFPFELLSVVLRNISENRDSKFTGLFDSGWKRYEEIRKECHSNEFKYGRFERYVKEFARKCRTTDNPNKLKVPVLELQEFNNEINRFVDRFTLISPLCVKTKGGDQLREEVQNEIILSVFGKKREIKLDVNQWIQSAKSIDLKNYLFEIDFTEKNNKIFRLIRDIIEEEEEEIKNRSGEEWNTYTREKQKKIIAQKRTKPVAVQSYLVDDYWARGSQYLLKEKIEYKDIDRLTIHIGKQLMEIKALPNKCSKELVDFFWTCIQQSYPTTTKDMTNYCLWLHQQIQEENREKYNLNSVLSDDEKTIISKKLLDHSDSENDTISKVILHNSLGLFDLLKDNFPINVHSKPEYFDYKNVLKLGNKLATFAEKDVEHMAIGAPNAHEIFTFLSDKIMDIFENEHILTETFAKSCEKGKLINWDEPVIEQIFDGPFGKFILSICTDRSRENIFVLLFALIHMNYLNKSIVSPGEREVEIRAYAKKIFDSSESKGHRWKTLLENEHICRKIIEVPYQEAPANEENWIWGRKKGEFAEAIAWNKSLIKILNEQNIENKLQLANDEWVASTSSLFDLDDEKAIKDILKKDITSNLNNKNWRDMVLLESKRPLLDEYMPFGTLIPGIETLDAIYLYDEINNRVHLVKQFGVKRLMKKMKKETGTSMFEATEKHLEHLSNFSISDLLIDFATFFNRKDHEGDYAIKKSLKWESLLETFANDSDRHSMIVGSINQTFERLDGTSIPETSTKFQRILIMFLQNYGFSSNSLMTNWKPKFPQNYSVTRNKKYETHIAANHDNHLKKLP